MGGFNHFGHGIHGIPDEKDLKWPCIEHGDRTQDICYVHFLYDYSSHIFSTGFSTMKAPNLTTEQWDSIIEQYTEIIVDGMEWKDMHRFVYDSIHRDLSELQSRQDLCDDIQYTFDQELLEELVDNVTTDTQPVDTSTYTYGLSEGETLSFPVHKKSSWLAVPIHRVSTILPMVGIFVYYRGMNKSNLQEFFPSLLQKGYSVREINESCKRHQERVAPDWFNGTYAEYMDEMHELFNGLWAHSIMKQSLKQFTRIWL